MSPAQQTVQSGQQFPVKVLLDSRGPLFAVGAFVDFDPAYLEVVSVDAGTTFPQTTVNRYDNAKGTIDFSAAIITGVAPTATITVATVQFKAKAKTGTTQVNFSSAKPRESSASYEGRPVFNGATGATIDIK